MLYTATVHDGVTGTGLVIPRCTTADAIHNGNERKHAAIKNGEQSPILPDVRQHSAFARITRVAQTILIVAPLFTIRIRHRRP